MSNTQEENGNLDEETQKLIQREKEWDNSVEGITYSLCMLPNCPNEVMWLIIKTVQKLPEEVKQFVYDNCEFGSMSESELYGCCIDVKRPWLILLKNEVTEFTVAHEIAHAKLNHTRAVVTGPTWKESEEAANNLVKKWGFTETLESEVKP